MVLLVIGLVLLAVGIVVTVQGLRLVSRARAVPRVQVPARLLDRTSAPGGWSMTVEFPGPDNLPRRAEVYALVSRGLGATPTFSGYVYVNPSDLTDVKTRPQGKVGPGWWLTIIGFVLIGAGIVGIATASIMTAFDSLGS